MDNELLLLSGNDIPFAQARVSVHQPKIREISFIGEESFHLGVQFLNFSEDALEVKDKSVLNDKEDFEIFMAIANNKESKKLKTNATLVLSLLFPDYQIKFSSDSIILKKDDFEGGISKFNYNTFKDILLNMFCLNQGQNSTDSGSYNPADERAKKIAEKFNKAKQKKYGNKTDEKIAIFSRYVSILAVGLKKDINELMDYTVYQLFDEYHRFKLKQDFDMYIKMKLAGASDIEEVEDWMKDIHA